MLVPLCGKSRDMLWLREQGIRWMASSSELAITQFLTRTT